MILLKTPINPSSTPSFEAERSRISSGLDYLTQLLTLCCHCYPPPEPNPMHLQAEAQCAWLDSEGLVDGVITDDNDAFLFGSSHVYRHIFDNKRCEIMRQIASSLKGLITFQTLKPCINSGTWRSTGCLMSRGSWAWTETI